MGASHSQTTYEKDPAHVQTAKKDPLYVNLLAPPRAFASDSEQKTTSHCLRDYCKSRRSGLKRKVLLLGLDGVGKTNLFTRLIQHYNQSEKFEPFSRPTVGYNVETIKVRHHHFCYRHTEKITLWDCGGESNVRSLWSYHYPNTSLLLWLINAHDRSRLDTSLHLLSQILTNPLLYRVPVLIILSHCRFDSSSSPENVQENSNPNLLTNLEVAFRFLATISTSRASTFQWQVIDLKCNDEACDDFKKLEQCFRTLMKL